MFGSNKISDNIKKVQEDSIKKANEIVAKEKAAAKAAAEADTKTAENNKNSKINIFNITGAKTIDQHINPNIIGNAATATKLAKPVEIGGVSFNGTANIDLPGVNKEGNQDTTGNAATASDVKPDSKLAKQLVDIQDAIPQGVPIGTIVMWSGENIPEGWVECDGETYNSIKTPNLQGRFIMGAGTLSGTNSKYSQGQNGGLEKVQLEVDEMPEHNHGYNDAYFQQSDDRWKGGGATGTNEGWVGFNKQNQDQQTTQSGGGGAHENRPPYYVLTYIMYVGKKSEFPVDPVIKPDM
jgi:microcystin-dependent protein